MARKGAGAEGAAKARAVDEWRRKSETPYGIVVENCRFWGGGGVIL